MLERLRRIRRDVGAAARARSRGAAGRPLGHPAQPGAPSGDPTAAGGPAPPGGPAPAHDYAPGEERPVSGGPAAEGVPPAEGRAATEPRPVGTEHGGPPAGHGAAATGHHVPPVGPDAPPADHRAAALEPAPAAPEEPRTADERLEARPDHGGHPGAAAAAAAPAPAAADRDRHLRARDEFGGFNLGATFFGWLVAVGLAALLVALLSAAGAATGLTDEANEATASSQAAETVGVVGGVLLLVVLLLAYYAGGYVAGRMSRFDGARQGAGVWLLGLLVTIALAILAAVAGGEYNVLERLELPRIPIDEGSLTTGGIVALVAILLGTLLAAVAGGKVGERYHRRVDRVGGIRG